MIQRLGRLLAASILRATGNGPMADLLMMPLPPSGTITLDDGRGYVWVGAPPIQFASRRVECTTIVPL